MYRTVLKWTLFLSLIHGFSLAASTRPNIVFVFTDDHATQAITAYDDRFRGIADTPHLDKLAAQGILFQRCMVTNSICGPSRATILTGKHSHANGFKVNENTHFDGTQQTFPKLLQNAGYETALIGKWHLGSDPTGFNHWDILPGQGFYYNPDFRTTDGRYRVNGYVTDIITDKAIHWLEEQRDEKKPFMLMVQHKAPHREWSPALEFLDYLKGIDLPEPSTLFDTYEGRGRPAREQDMSIAKSMTLGKDLKVQEYDFGGHLARRLATRMTKEQYQVWVASYAVENQDFLKREKRMSPQERTRWKYQRYIKDYLRCIRSVDNSVGKLRAQLEALGLSDNTVFIYASDQGFYLGEHGWFDKRFMYDESFRTPFIVSWPEVTPEGIKNTNLVSNLDFAQTFLDIAGAALPKDMQGMSLVPLLKGKAQSDWRDSLYYHYYEFPGWHMVHRHEGVYDGRYKLINYYDLGAWELYDLESDPQEMRNCYEDAHYSDIAKQMHTKLERLRTQYEVPQNEVQDVSKVTDRYHSAGQLKSALDQIEQRLDLN